ncbi:lysophospholipid acyltransferase family protein [Limosilactobacillus caecicola]|uniref:lysophospholipid acyltransferase family protein n=1 Tax=Limosilactobacillus caecicola TaxID=2941332 RepID=UPI00203AC445|nr:lysophospholipid acyltransferase family protein [Limosilactobacillus caecicola]
MIIGDDRQQVIRNIQAAANQRNFTAKTEIGDPVMSVAERKQLVNEFWEKQGRIRGHFNNGVGRSLFNLLARSVSASTKVEGIKNLKGLPKTGAIVTANHFNQVDALAIKRLAQRKHRHLDVVIEDTNLKLPGFFSYLMNYIGTIPLVNTPSYINRNFVPHLKTRLAKRHWVLIFPEQEMWWNYRKPRVPQRGAYYFAALAEVPVISTFVEIQTLAKLEKQDPNFYQTRYVVHVLPPIYPDLKLAVNERSKKMMEQDYHQKVRAYEHAYQKRLDYDFTDWDIAGWRGNHD